MTEKVWFIYINGESTGPFSQNTVIEILAQTDVAHTGFLFRVGWKEWRPYTDCLEELGVSCDIMPPPPPMPSNLTRPPRATIKGQIVVHNNGQLIIGAGVNISSTGIFVETKDSIFNVGEVLKLTCRVDGFLKPFNANAEVMRFNNSPKSPSGYGLKFIKLDEVVKQQIESLIRGSGLDSKTRGA